MVAIKKIEIEGYFGQGVFKWELDPVVNILGGKNGSGKTSILMLCHTLLCGNGIKANLNKRLTRLFNNYRKDGQGKRNKSTDCLEKYVNGTRKNI